MPTALRLDHRHWAERRRLQLLDELRGRLRAIDFDCMADPTGARRDELCAIICRHELGPGGLPRVPAAARGSLTGSGRIGFNEPVTLRDLATGEHVTCHIGCPRDSTRETVSPPRPRLHADHRVCCTSPLGNALIGRQEGETVEVRGGGRTLRYEIVSVG
jgi:hypothetical protein